MLYEVITVLVAPGLGQIFRNFQGKRHPLLFQAHPHEVQGVCSHARRVHHAGRRFRGPGEIDDVLQDAVQPIGFVV